MKFYVAASSREIDRAEKMIAALTAAGGECTHDWTKVMRANLPDSELPDDILLFELRRSFAGVMQAEHVFVLAPSSTTQGLSVELGGAAASRRGPGFSREIHEVGPTTVAWIRALRDIRHADDAAAVRWFSEEVSCLRAVRGGAA